ncbi:EamA/RhaT family transporter, partial [Pseudoalteromonas aliena]
LNHFVLNRQSMIAVVAALSASLCYDIASHYTKNAPKLATFDNAHGSMWASSFIVLPIILFITISEIQTTNVLLGV